MAIYTKRGDKGETSLYDIENRQNKRVSKYSTKINTIGLIDELNSYIGICVSYSKEKQFKKFLINIQKDLLTIGSILAGSKLVFSKTKTRKLENIIDDIEGRLPALNNFVIPGGSTLSSHLQYARSLSRKAERNVVALSQEESIKPQILMFLNRLSDFLFMLSRQENHNSGVKEEIWIGKKTY